MTTRNWRGGNGDFYDPAQWLNGAPIFGDTAIVSAGDILLPGTSAPISGVYDAQIVKLGSNVSASPAQMTITDAELGSFFTISSDPGSGYANLLSIGTSGFSGVLNADAFGGTFTLATQANGSAVGDFVLLAGGLIHVSDGDTFVLTGRMDVESEFKVDVGGVFVNDGTLNVLSTYASNPAEIDTVEGTGQIRVGVGAQFVFGDSSPATQTIKFVGTGGEILIDTVNDFASPIQNFLPGDIIALPNVPATSAFYDLSTGLLTAYITTGGFTFAVASLHVSGPTSSGFVQTTPNGTGGTLLSYPGAAPVEKFAIQVGDQAMGGNIARATLTTHAGAPIDGTGVKIGILSVSFNEQPRSATAGADYDAINGYLPYDRTTFGSAVTVIDNKDGTPGSDDEGRAMAELVHQVAPGAQIFFYAPTTLTDFAAGIDAMVQDGVNIVVDDLAYTEEPFFQVAGPLDTAIQNAIDAGVNYFTSADNYGNAYYAAAFKPKTTTLPGVTGSVSAQVFSDGTTLQTITITLQSIIALQWDAPFSTAGGTPQALSMVLYQNGKPVKSATQVADPGSGFANEPEIAMGGVTPGTYQLAIYQTAGMPKVATFRYSLFGSGTGTGPGGYIDDPAAMNGIGNVFGHGLVPGVNTVASVDWANTPAFLGNSTFTEPASDDGPGELLFDSNGNRLAKPLADGKPNFTAPDGVSMTPDLTGFQPFYGTSAAAPDAAAVAALMLQANPNLTPAQVTADLEASAVSLGLSADRQGAGLVQAVGAVKLALAPVLPSVPDLAPASDSGVSHTDNITNVTTPTFNGKGDAGSTITLFDGATVIGTAKADASGSWSIKSSVLSAGVHGIKAQASDAGGDTSAFTQPLSVTIDTTAPAVPSVPDLAAASDSGTSSTDNVTNVTTPTFSGKGDVGSTVTLYDGATVIGTAKADATGNWSITSSLLSAGVHAIKAQASDTAGNISAFTQSLSVTVDTTVAVPSVPDLAAASDSGTSNTDNITSVTTPVFSGKGDVGSTVTLHDGATVIGTAKADATGNWAIKSSLLSAGVHAIKAQASDTAGNASAFTPSLTVTIDTTAPAVPTALNLAAASDSGVSNTDNITNVTTPTFNGKGDVGSTVTLYDGATAVGATKADAFGNWSIKSSLLSAGVHAIKVRASDAAGNTSTFTQPLSVTIDTTAPAVPSVPDLAAVSDSGVSNTDNITSVTTPIFNGKGAVGSTVTLYDGATVIGTAKADATGNWSIKSSLLSAGVHAIKAQASDTAGNASAFTQSLSVTIDTTAPAAPTVPNLAAASDSGVSNTDNITNVTTPIFNGKGDVGSKVTLYDGSTAVGTTRADALGNWSVKSSLLSAGVHAIKARASDTAGNASAFSQSLSVTISTAAPAALGVPLGSTSGTISFASLLGQADQPTFDNAPATVSAALDPDVGTPGVSGFHYGLDSLLLDIKATSPSIGQAIDPTGGSAQDSLLGNKNDLAHSVILDSSAGMDNDLRALPMSFGEGMISIR